MSRSSYYGGLAAEDIAARHYEAEGGTMLARRWRCPEGEIDLVVSLSGLIVFAEVKARRRHAAAAFSISERQWRRIGAAASVWLAQEAEAGTPCRFDVVLIDGSGALELIENAASFDGW